ncbi:MAG: hypothetical protein IPG87_17195, partial [Saprospiraceae bacterium]|nr:hypothetical protein [Candidatus Vicinibacter affinis]
QFDGTRNGDDAFVAVFSKDLGTLHYSTYLGDGGNETEYGVTSLKALSDTTYIVAFNVVSALPSFYHPAAAYQTTFGGVQDMFIMKFGTTINAVTWGTYIGGLQTETINDIALYSDGKVAFAGYGFSTLTEVLGAPAATRSAATTNNDGIIGVLSSNGQTMLYLDEIGGANNDRIFDVEVYNSFLYWTGAVSSGFPASSSGVYDATHNGALDAIIGVVKDDGTNYKATFMDLQMAHQMNKEMVSNKLPPEVAEALLVHFSWFGDSIKYWTTGKKYRYRALLSSNFSRWRNRHVLCRVHKSS